MSSHGHPDGPIGIRRAAPVFPVRDLDAAMRFYARLGFSVRRYDAGYGFAERERLQLHLRAAPELEPYSSYSEVYVHTARVDELHAEWRMLELIPVRREGITPELIAEVKRRFAAGEPVGLISELVEDKPWDIREFSIRDFDNNQLRFGRPSSGGTPEGNALEENG